MLLSACKSDKQTPAADASANAPLQVATFNAGLLDAVGYVPQRLPLVKDALAGLDVELLCVQEFWQKAHWDALVQAEADKLPHVLRIADHPGVAGKCTPDEFNPVQTCAQAKCNNVAASDLVACTSTECAAPVAELSSSCISCLLDNASSGDFDAIAAACVGGGGAASDAGVLTPDKRAYFLGGSFGIGLLSAYPLLKTETKELDSSTERRGIMYAQLEHPRLGTLHVFCTHLAAVENGVKYEGSYGDWEGENAAHMKALRDWAKEKAGDGGKVLLLGDLNSGPAGKNIAPSVADDYALLPAAGFKDLFLSSDNAACTFCKDNPLVDPTDAAADADIDHIMTRGLDVKSSAMRMFTEPVEINVSMHDADAGTSDAGTKKETVRLSDHYALHASIGE